MERYHIEKDYLRARQLLEQQRWAEAEKLLGRLATTDMRDDSFVHYQWAFSVLQSGHQKRAEEMALAAVKLFPEEECLHLLLGQIARQKDQTRRAIRHFEDALRLEPQHCDVLANYALALCDAQNYKKAQKVLQSSLNLDPEHRLSLVAQAELLRLMERNREADAVLKTTLKLNPESSLVHSVTANNAFDSGDYEAAAQYYREALRLNPMNDDAREMLLQSLKGRFWAFRVVMWVQRKMGHLPSVVRLLIFVLLVGLTGGLFLVYFVLAFIVDPVCEVLLAMKPENRFLFSPERWRGMYWARWGVGLVALSVLLLPVLLLSGVNAPVSLCAALFMNGAMLSATALKAFEGMWGAFWAIMSVLCFFSCLYVAAFMLDDASFAPAFFLFLVYLWYRE